MAARPRDIRRADGNSTPLQLILRRFVRWGRRFGCFFDLARGQRLVNTLTRTPAHFPEVGFEPGGFLEDRDQLCLAGRRGVEIGETFQVRPRFRRDLLVWCTGNIRRSRRDRGSLQRAQRVARRAASRSRRSRSRRGERHLECQQIAAHSGVEYVARIGQHLDRRRGLFEIARATGPSRRRASHAGSSRCREWPRGRPPLRACRRAWATCRRRARRREQTR